jgi:general secretion pathway protein A
MQFVFLLTDDNRMSIFATYWGLNRSPFENTSDADFFFRSETHRAALLKMRYVIENRLGAGLLVGGVGVGKTYLAHLLERELPDGTGTMVHLLFPQLNSAELLAYLAVELGADESAVGRGRDDLNVTLRQLEQRLRHWTSAGRHPVIIIDDAHLIEDPQVFRTLQLLLNYQQRPDINFSLLLIGEPNLLGPIERMAQLNERLGARGLLKPLSHEETAGYVRHRLETAGRTERIFEDDALAVIFELSGGVPRRINRLCDLALLVGYADELKTLSAAEIEAVGEELLAVVPD